VVVLVAAVITLVSQLDQPWLKRPLQRLVSTHAGFDIDYGAVRLSGSPALRIDIEQLRVLSPVALRKHAPELLRVGHLGLQLAPAALYGSTPWLPRVELDQVTLAVVVDEHGRTSFDTPPSAATEKSAPATPLSRRAEVMLGDRLPLRRLHASDVALTLVHTERGLVVGRDQLSGLSLDVDAIPFAHGTRLRLAIGAPRAPVALALERRSTSGRELTAQLRVSLALQATASEAQVSLDARVTRQDFVPALPLDVLAQLDAHARFDPAHQCTELTVTQLELADGAVTAGAALRLPDRGAPSVRHAAGHIDALHLVELAAVWSTPIKLRSGHLRYSIDNLVLDPPTAVRRRDGPASSEPRIQVDGELKGVSFALHGRPFWLGEAALSLHGAPTSEGLRVRGTASLDALRLESAEHVRQRADDVVLELSGLQTWDGAIAGDASLRFSRLEASGPTSVVATGGALSLHTPTAARLDGLLAVDGTLALTRLLVTKADSQVLTDLPVQLRVALRDLILDLQHPEQSLGSVHATLGAGALHGEVDASRAVADVSFDVSASGEHLDALVPLLPEGPLRQLPWPTMGLTLHTRGRFDRLATAQPRLRQQTELRVTNAAFDGLSANLLSLALRSHGTRMRHDAHADLTLEGLRVGETLLGRDQLSLGIVLDRAAPSLHVELKNDRLPETLLDASVRFDRKSRAVVYDLSAQLSHLAPVATLLSGQRAFAGFDVSDTTLQLRSEGRLTGLVTRVDANGPVLAPDVLKTASGQGSFELSGTDLHWSEGDNAVFVPAATLRASLRGEGPRRTVESELHADQLEGTFDQKQVAITGFHDETSVTLTGGLDGTIEHAQRVSIQAMQQQLVPSYVVGDLTANLVAQRGRDGLIKLSELRVDNRAGGTTFSLAGGIELGVDERRVSLRSTLEQDLTRFSNRPETFAGRGRVAVDVALSSPDLRVFHSAATLKLRAATIRLPQEQVVLESIDGEMPIATDFVVDRNGVEILRGARINPYTTQRFADQHPLLGYRSFVSIANVQTPFVSLSPFAANLEVARNIVSLSQLEMGVRGGTVTGSGIFEYNGAESVLHANVRASGVNSSHDEPFDGNAALTIGIRERSIEGRADILRIGRRHLTDLLDLQDPLHADPSISQIRSALRFGYPDRVRLSFQHGFASAGVNFGGLARLLKVNDVRGIPVGPLMERVMSSLASAEVTR